MSKEETIKVYVTKYALTTGVFVLECEIYEGTYYKHDSKEHGHFFLHIGTDAFPLEAAAVQAVKKMAENQLVALEKKREKMKNILLNAQQGKLPMLEKK